MCNWVLVTKPDFDSNLKYKTVLRSLHSKSTVAQIRNLLVIVELIKLRGNVYSLPHNHMEKSDIRLILNHLCSD
jgi:hypothetical protein